MARAMTEQEQAENAQALAETLLEAIGDVAGDLPPIVVTLALTALLASYICAAADPASAKAKVMAAMDEIIRDIRSGAA